MKTLAALLNLFLWILQRFAVFSALAALSFRGTVIEMIFHGLFWPYKMIFWFFKNMTLNTGFREASSEVGSAIWNGLIGFPTNLSTKPIACAIIAGIFLIIHFWHWPIRELRKNLNKKLKSSQLQGK